MDQKMNGLSPDFIIHPGETLREILEDREMTQRELASRTEVTEKHVSTIINGKKNISNAYARKLEYALGIDASFWINLQADYDKELAEFEELHNISKDEVSVLKHLKLIIQYLCTLKLVDDGLNEGLLVLSLRRILGVSNLTSIPSITYNAAYRAQTSSKIDIYVVFAWQRLCEILTNNIDASSELDLKKLEQSIPTIKGLMFEHPNKVHSELCRIFAECGIKFKIVKHFAGAPVQGFIKRSNDGTIILCMTIRGGSADRFWFTLFHEIGHILNGDIKEKFIDFESISSEMENRADMFASNTLIDNKEYNAFVEYKDYSITAITRFAQNQGVSNFIVIGRLQRDNIIQYNQYSSYKPIYKWAAN